jgi:PKD repeat protein
LVELRNSAGTVLASANPEEALNATLSFAVPLAGTYYVSVQGVGKGDPLTTGYTNYGSVGNYTLTVTALTTAGTAPVAAIVATPTTGLAPLTVSLSGAGSTDSDGTIASYAWAFGDGSTANGATTSKVYTTAGTYTAVLTVTDNSGLTATKSVVITVNAGNKAPVAAVTATPISGTAPVTVSFSGAGSTDSDGTIASYAWAFGDGTTGTGVTASKIYSNAGTYTAVLTVTDNGGLTATKSVVITVAAANKAPVAAVTATPTTGTAPLTVSFSGTGSTDTDGSITAYEWTFGDGSTATGATTNHLYSTAGTYTAQLRVVDNLGLSAIKTVPITVNAAAAGPAIRVAGIALSVSVSGGRASGVAGVKVVDSKGVGVPGATITGTWSGLAAGTATLTSNSIGNVTFVSASTTATSGTFTFTVNSVVRSGYTYDPSLNTETTDSIAR